jgi:hypothetical protein
MKTTLNTRHERARHNVTLQSTDDKTKDSLAKVSCRCLTGIIQKAIDDTIHQDKPVLLGVQKRRNDSAIRIRCNTKEEANMLQEMDWEASVEELEAHKLKYGIVVHKVDKKPYDKLTHNENETWIKLSQI